jgi:hypothetical protein
MARMRLLCHPTQWGWTSKNFLLRCFFIALFLCVPSRAFAAKKIGGGFRVTDKLNRRNEEEEKKITHIAGKLKNEFF